MILIAFGANLPFGGKLPAENVMRAMRAVSALGTDAKCSQLYRSEAWPDPDEPEYTNAVMSLADSDLAPELLLCALHTIEESFGRRRGREVRRNVPRTMDIDLLDYHRRHLTGDQLAGLVLPHPGIDQRDFVLQPLMEVAPGWCHPVSGRSVGELLNMLVNSHVELSAHPVAPEVQY